MAGAHCPMLLALPLLLLGFWRGPGELFDFESTKTGDLPAGWLEVKSDSSFGHNWAVFSHLEAVSGSQILAKIAARSNPSPLPKAIRLGRSLRDGEVRVHIKPMGGLGPQRAGLILRYRDEDNFYIVGANLLTGEVFVQRTEAGKTSAVPTNSGKFQPDPVSWIHFRVVFAGPRIVVFVNGRECAEGVDSTDGWVGRVGVWAASGSFTFLTTLKSTPSTEHWA